jgi:hypothetical protein
MISIQLESLMTASLWGKVFFFYYYYGILVCTLISHLILTKFATKNTNYLFYEYLFSPAPTLRSLVRIPLRHGCLCVFCVRFFCFYIVSNETASRPNKRLMRIYHWISLFMSYKVSKLAYRIWVILIANKRVTKKIYEYLFRQCNTFTS